MVGLIDASEGFTRVENWASWRLSKEKMHNES